MLGLKVNHVSKSGPWCYLCMAYVICVRLMHATICEKSVTVFESYDLSHLTINPSLGNSNTHPYLNCFPSEIRFTLLSCNQVFLQQLCESRTGYIHINLPRYANITSQSLNFSFKCTSRMYFVRYDMTFCKDLGLRLTAHNSDIILFMQSGLWMYLFESSHSSAYLALYNIYRVLACLQKFSWSFS